MILYERPVDNGYCWRLRFFEREVDFGIMLKDDAARDRHEGGLSQRRVVAPVILVVRASMAIVVIRSPQGHMMGAET